jgi:hypothetical protein
MAESIRVFHTIEADGRVIRILEHDDYEPLPPYYSLERQVCDAMGELGWVSCGDTPEARLLKGEVLRLLKAGKAPAVVSQIDVRRKLEDAADAIDSARSELDDAESMVRGLEKALVAK